MHTCKNIVILLLKKIIHTYGFQTNIFILTDSGNFLLLELRLCFLFLKAIFKMNLLWCVIWIWLADDNVFGGQEVHERQSPNSKISPLQRLELLERPAINSAIPHLKLIIALGRMLLLFLPFHSMSQSESLEQLVVINYGSQKLPRTHWALALSERNCPTELSCDFSLSHLTSDSVRRILKYQIIPSSYLARIFQRIVGSVWDFWTGVSEWLSKLLVLTWIWELRFSLNN